MSEPVRNTVRILAVDDQADVREALRMLLKFAEYAMTGASSPEEALALLEREDYAAVLVDMNYSRDTTSGAEGLALIARINALRPDLPVIAMTAWANIELAVEAMRVGAADFIEKPWQNERVLSVLEMRIPAAARRRGRAECAPPAIVADGFVADSAAMRRLMAELERVTDSDASVLLLGENGTGKSLIAQRLHQRSARRDKPFVRVDVGGLAPALFEAELFGHVRGAYTDARQDRAGRFELADGGTLFLDEIGNLPPEQQPKLLRAIEDGEFERVGSSRTQRVDVRIIAATNADLDAEVAAGRFRRDLLYRLNTFQARVPPLRERHDDILPLARHYLAQACRRYRRPLSTLSADVEGALLAHEWPGNVRELANAMERAALLANEGRLTTSDLRLEPPTQAPPGERVQLERMRLDEAEAMLLRAALEQHQGNLQRAAEQLGITRQSLYRRLENTACAATMPTERDPPHVLWVAAPALVALALVLAIGVPAPLEAAMLFALVLALTWATWRIVRNRPRQFRTIGSLLDALREGDYGVRGALPEDRDDFHDIVQSFNVLAERLQDERRDVQESLQLLSKTLAALDGAVFAFDDSERLRLVNPAGERLLGRPGQNLLGLDAETLDLAELFRLPSSSIHARAFSGQSGRWQITHTVLRSRGQAGRLLLVQPMERALREEEAHAFRRLLRVLSHEINNSMAPIASMADTLRRMLAAESSRADTELDSDLRHGLGLIEQRSVALQRFIGGYAQLAKLPPPQRDTVKLAPLCERVSLLLDTTRIDLQRGADIDVFADADQLEHVLINLLRNALDAGGDGPVLLRWSRSDREAIIEIVDHGHGLPKSGDFFVPFFTTKPGGAGIGLTLCRQIVEAQDGSLALHPRDDAPGAIAVIRLPLATGEHNAECAKAGS